MAAPQSHIFLNGTPFKPQFLQAGPPQNPHFCQTRLPIFTLLPPPDPPRTVDCCRSSTRSSPPSSLSATRPARVGAAARTAWCRAASSQHKSPFSDPKLPPSPPPAPKSRSSAPKPTPLLQKPTLQPQNLDSKIPPPPHFASQIWQFLPQIPPLCLEISNVGIRAPKSQRFAPKIPTFCPKAAPCCPIVPPLCPQIHIRTPKIPHFPPNPPSGPLKTP